MPRYKLTRPNESGISPKVLAYHPGQSRHVVVHYCKRVGCGHSENRHKPNCQWPGCPCGQFATERIEDVAETNVEERGPGQLPSGEYVLGQPGTGVYGSAIGPRSDESSGRPEELGVEEAGSRLRGGDNGDAGSKEDGVPHRRGRPKARPSETLVKPKRQRNKVGEK